MPVIDPSAPTLAVAFAAVARRIPNRIALRFESGESWTYAELACRAASVSRALAEFSIDAEARVAVIGERSAATVTAILGVLGTGGAYCIIDPTLPVALQRQYLQDLAPVAIILADHVCTPLDCGGLPTLRISEVPIVDPLEFNPPSIPASALAYVLFTSGSTGRPKGVMVEHRSVLSMVGSVEALAPSEDGFTGSWVSPPAFDVSVWEIFSVLVTGGTVHIPGESWLGDGDEFWRRICDARIESAYAPPGLVAGLAAASERRPGTLKRLLVGVEPIPQGVLERLNRACRGLQIVNGYGPTEATICATLHLFHGTREPHRRVPIGQAVNGSSVALLQNGLLPTPPGESGEIVIFGDCLARGYLNASPGGFVTIGGERAYRTGDIGRLLSDGSLEFVGREDGQVKISGFRVEIAEVEAALAATPDIRRGVVLVAGDDNAKRLVAVAEAPDHVNASGIRAHLVTLLPAHAIPSRIAVMDTLPVSTNGKIDKDRLLAASRERPVDAPAFVFPRTDWELEVAESWSRVLEIAEIGIDDDFRALGGRSLDAVRIAAYLAARGHRISSNAVLAAGTIRRMQKPITAAARLEPVPPGCYPAGKTHEGLWAWRELHPESSRTTVVHAIRLDRPIDPQRMSLAWRSVVARHEALRTTFDLHAGDRLMQIVSSTADSGYETVEVDHCAAVDTELLQWLDHRFDVRTRPWAARLLVGKAFGVFVLAADHLVLDGEAAQIVQRDLALAYDDPAAIANPIPGPTSLTALLTPTSEQADVLHALARAELTGSTERPMLPEPLAREQAGPGVERIHASFDQDLWREVRRMARHASTTPFVVVLAALKTFLRLRDGQPDNTVAIALSLRQVIGRADAVGHFVNLVPIRDVIAAADAVTLSFGGYLDQMSELFASAIADGQLPFEAMDAETLGSGGNTGSGPARVVLVQQPADEMTTTRCGLRFETWPTIPMNAIYDLTLFVREPGATRPGAFEWVWSAHTTTKTFISWLTEAFPEFLRAAVAAPDALLGTLPALGAMERDLVLTTARPDACRYDAEKQTLVALFQAQVERRPDAVAVEEKTGPVSYGELSQRASAFAAALDANAPAGPVVVVLDKSADQLAAMLATLSLGRAYLPLAPDHACTRLPDLAIRAGAHLCITDSRLAEVISLPRSCRVVRVDAIEPGEVVEPPLFAHTPIDPDDLAYVMPTSGSTGVPKLVGVPHRAVVRLVHCSETIPLDERDATMLVANASFDAATLEIWGALANGGRVVVPGEEVLRDPARLCTAIERHGVTCGFFTTTIFEQMLPYAAQLVGMKHVIVGGEVVPPRVFGAAARIIPRGVLVNGYGPTENTTFSCCFRLDRDPHQLRSIPIGVPITGSGAVVVDETLRMLAPGMPGEILVTGAGLAVGYVDDPELSQRRFVSIPSLSGMRAYRTGDLGRLLPDGVFEYLGRLDRQLKIHGFRVEPGEVEAILATHSAVRRSAAYADDLGGVKALVAAVEAAKVTEAELRAWVAERLPAFMVPTRIHIVDHFPVTANGKLDIGALHTISQITNGEADAPSTAVERMICKVAAQLLGLSVVSPNDDLFALGANSMMALALASRLRERVGSPVPAHWIFEGRTPRSLASRVEGLAATSRRAPPRHLIDRVARIKKPPQVN